MKISNFEKGEYFMIITIGIYSLFTDITWYFCLFVLIGFFLFDRLLERKK